MYVNLISQPQIKNLKNNETNILKKEPNFKAKLTPEMEGNCYKIIAATDLWGKPTVRIPQSKIEKEAVLEVLYHRLHLEKLSRLYNQLFVTHAKIDRENELLEKAPKSPELAQLSRELDAMGNLKTYFMTLNRKIEDQEKRNKTSLKYFDDIDAMEAQYREQKILNDNKFQKLYADFKKGKIEANSIEELINIIESNEVKKDNIIQKIFSNIQPKKSKRNQLLDDMTNAYRYYLRQFIDPYDSILDRSKQATEAITLVLKKYRPIINTYYNEGANKITQKDLSAIFKKVQHEFTEHSYYISQKNVEVFPLDEAWPIVNENKEIIKKIAKDVNSEEESTFVNMTFAGSIVTNGNAWNKSVP